MLGFRDAKASAFSVASASEKLLAFRARRIRMGAGLLTSVDREVGYEKSAENCSRNLCSSDVDRICLRVRHARIDREGRRRESGPNGHEGSGQTGNRLRFSFL